MRMMMKSEELDCGTLFDHIDDFLDVPSDLDLDLNSFPSLDSAFTNSLISPDLSLPPYEGVVQLDWLSSFFSVPSTDHPSRASSPVSVLDSSSSSSNSSSSVVASRPRSKRPRPTSVNIRPITAPPLPPSVTSPNSVESSLVTESSKKKKIRFTLPEAPPVRKCLHCEIAKTPQWRAGPMGPKTLCNACGVRYKSGRLFPEYRPAASPTFVPSMHSNSHRKVMEMRSETA